MSGFTPDSESGVEPVTPPDKCPLCGFRLRPDHRCPPATEERQTPPPPCPESLSNGRSLWLCEKDEGHDGDHSFWRGGPKAQNFLADLDEPQYDLVERPGKALTNRLTCIRCRGPRRDGNALCPRCRWSPVRAWRMWRSR